MIRTMIFGVTLAILGGCSSSQKTKVTRGSPDQVIESPKPYQSSEMSQGGSAGFGRPPASSNKLAH